MGVEFDGFDVIGVIDRIFILVEGGKVHQLVGHHELGFGKRGQRQNEAGVGVLGHIRQADGHSGVGNGFDHAAEAFAAVERIAEFHLGFVADMGPKIAGPHQRAVDTGRGDLQMIFAVDGILDIEHRRDVLAEALAVGDGEAAIGILGHDLQRATVFLRNLDADQRIAEVVGDRLDDARDPRLEAGFLDVAFFGQVEGHVNGLCMAVARTKARNAPAL